MDIIFKTIHGSRLYGLAHENSDWDYYTVVDRVPKKKASYSTHTIVDGVDSVVVDFGTWVNACQAGQPQALEAMFSQMAEIDTIPEFRYNFRAGTNYNSFMAIMKRMSYEHEDSFKHKRHILRLAWEVSSLKRYNRFNPTLGPVEIEMINTLALLDMKHVYNDAVAIAQG